MTDINKPQKESVVSTTEQNSCDINTISLQDKANNRAQELMRARIKQNKKFNEKLTNGGEPINGTERT